MPVGLRLLGTGLVVADPLQQSMAIVVFGGHVPFRAMEAARLYQDRWAQEVWVTQGANSEEARTLQDLGIVQTVEHDISRQVLERLEVPPQAIQVIPGHNANTAQEVRTVADALQARQGTRAILVTSKLHTRRVRVLWNQLVDDRFEAVVRYTSDDQANPARWWQTTSDARAVAREWFGLINAELGFPMRSVRVSPAIDAPAP
jgi:uncharacterized SAM-binding protein YcdF (DUF218 family)